MPAHTETSTRPSTAGSGPRGFGARDLALVATFTALIVVLGLAGRLYPFGMAVPITLQSLGVMLAGALLGWKRGAASVLVLLLLCAAGLPVLAGGLGGLGVFVGPTGGFLLGYLAGAAAVGALVQARLPKASFGWILLANVIGGIGVVHLFGVPGMMLRGGMDLQKALAVDLVFMPGDAIKALVAAGVAVAVHRAIPDLAPPLRRR